MDPVPAALNLDKMFPDLEHEPMRYVLHMCGLRDIPSQTRLIEYEGLDDISDLANYTDSELDAMADRNSKHSPTPTSQGPDGLSLHEEAEGNEVLDYQETPRECPIVVS